MAVFTYPKLPLVPRKVLHTFFCLLPPNFDVRTCFLPLAIIRDLVVLSVLERGSLGP